MAPSGAMCRPLVALSLETRQLSMASQPAATATAAWHRSHGLPPPPACGGSAPRRATCPPAGALASRREPRLRVRDSPGRHAGDAPGGARGCGPDKHLHEPLPFHRKVRRLAHACPNPPCPRSARVSGRPSPARRLAGDGCAVPRPQVGDRAADHRCARPMLRQVVGTG